MSVHSVIIHQHYYQPPREDPWYEVIEAERSAAPDHDWNQRITRECYSKQAAAEAWLLEGARAAPSVADRDARVGLARLINLYAWCSFDVGATLCEWFDSEAPEVMQAMQAGDAASIARWGYGNALAAPYHHVILPLASPRDRRTEIRWGIRDFTRRFGRKPDGFWFPECAVDENTLEAAAAEGIRFTVLAPYQIQGANSNGMPVLWKGASGREIIIVPYDGSLAGDVAFGGLLDDARALASRLTPFRDTELTEPRCTTLATDGETFGHHHHGGESALAEAISLLSRRTSSKLTNLASLVANHPPETTVAVVSPSSWSCAHGVERWRSNCGCRVDTSRPPAQQWRGPLRNAMEQLAEQCNSTFEREGQSIFREDPWTVRDRYGEVVAHDGEILSGFVNSQVHNNASESERQRARELLELARATLRLFTSCAWFFDDVDRIEVRQALRYAARSIDLSRGAGRLTPELMQWLGTASTGAPNAVSAADVFVRDALPHAEPPMLVAAAMVASHNSGIGASRYGAFEATVQQEPSGDWHVSLIHRRTGRAGEYVARVSGSGPATTVAIGPHGSDPATRSPIHIHQFPDQLARDLLLVDSLTDAGMFAES